MVVVFLVDTLVYSTYIFRGVVLARVDEVGGGGETVCTLLPPKCKTKIAPPIFGRACYKQLRNILRYTINRNPFGYVCIWYCAYDIFININIVYQIRSPCPVIGMRQKTWSPIFLRPFPSPSCIGYHFSIGKRSFALRCVSSSTLRAGLPEFPLTLWHRSISL